MRRINFIGRATLFTPAVSTNVTVKRALSIKNIKYFAKHDNIKTLIENIHDANFSGEFSGTDIANLRLNLTEVDNYYQLLKVNPELERSVFERELKQKYHALCLRFHPDCTAGHCLKTQIFKLIKNAYEALSDPSFRNDCNVSSPEEYDPFMSFFRGKHRSSSRKSTVLGTSLFSLGEDNDIRKISISKCGHYIAALTYQNLRILDAKTNTLLYQFPANYCTTSSLAFNADSKKIAFCNHLSLNMLTIKTGRRITNDVVPYRLSSSFLQSMLCLNNGNFVSTSEHGSLEIWDGQTGRHIRTLKGHIRDVHALLMIPNSPTLISGSWDKTIKIWNMDTENCEHTLSGFDDLIYTIALSPDAKYLVAGSGNGFFGIWDFERKQLLSQFKGYEWTMGRHGKICGITGILISPDSRCFVSIANCPAAKIWDMESGEQVGEKTLPAYPSSIFHSGEHMLIGFDDGTVRQFTFSDFGYERVYDQHMTTIQ